MNILTINSLTKFYGRIRALNEVSFSVPEGCIYGILGPNGSGKTTLLGVITDVLKPTSGSYTLFESTAAPHKLRQQIGTLLETPNFYHYLSASQNLRIVAAIKGHGEDQIDEVLQRVNLYERRNSKFTTFSLGMKQRLAIAAALLGNPKVLIFDEPTNGLDPEGIAEIRNLIKQLGAEGKSIIMASHLLDEVEKVCTHVAVLKKGELLAAGTVENLLTNEETVQVSADNIQQLYEVLQQWKGDYHQIRMENNVIHMHFAVGKACPEEINRYCFSQQIVLSLLMIGKKSLEAKFFELTK